MFFDITVIASEEYSLDLSNYIVTWGIFKLTAFSPTAQIYIGTKGSYLYPLGRFLSYYLTAVRCFLLISSSINRLTAIKMPSKHETFWSKYWILITAFCFTAPLPYTFQSLFGRSDIYITSNPTTVLIYVDAPWFPFSPALINAVQSVTTAFLTFVFNLATLILLKAKTQFAMNGKNKAELSLAVICCWDFLTNIVFAVYNTLIFYDRQNNSISNSFIKMSLIVWIYDLNNLSRPIFFLFMCKDVKIQFFGLFRRNTFSAAVNQSKVPRVTAVT